MTQHRESAERGEGGFFGQLLENPRARRWILLAGVLGILLIFLSGFFSGGGKEEAAENTGDEAAQTSAAYAAGLEESLAALISSMEGAGDAQVLVTLDRSSEQIYATEERSSNRVQSEAEDGENETTYFSVRGSDGSEQALPLLELQPVVRGVVVVCPGGGDPAVRERITQAVTTALDVSSARVCVLPSKS